MLSWFLIGILTGLCIRCICKPHKSEEEKFKEFVQGYPLDKWALAVMNSSRSYVRMVTDALDDKKKVLFSNLLRTLDGNISKDEQIQWRRTIAQAAYEAANLSKNFNLGNLEQDEIGTQKSA